MEHDHSHKLHVGSHHDVHDVQDVLDSHEDRMLHREHLFRQQIHVLVDPNQQTQLDDLDDLDVLGSLNDHGNLGDHTLHMDVLVVHSTHLSE